MFDFEFLLRVYLYGVAASMIILSGMIITVGETESNKDQRSSYAAAVLLWPSIACSIAFSAWLGATHWIAKRLKPKA